MAWHVWLAYFVASWLIALSPGSGAVLSMSHGLQYGVRQASATIAGLQIGLAFILIVAGAGVGALLVASATAFTVVKVLGAGYLVWLGIKQWRAPAVPLVAEADDGGPLVKRRAMVLHGMLINIVNPKGTVFLLAVVPQFIDLSQALAPQYLAIGATIGFTDLVVMAGYTALASRVLGALKSQAHIRAMNRVFGGLFVLAGSFLAFFKRAA